MPVRRARGFTLMEVLVALAIMGVIGVITSQAFYTAQTGAAVTRESMERLGKIDKVFVLLENDLRYAQPVVRPRSFGQPLSPLYVSASEDYWLTVLRGGYDNSLFLPRTEEVRVGYRMVDDEIWRDTWYNPTESEQEDARPMRLLDGVKTITVEALDTASTSLVSGWLRDWPKAAGSPELPRALRVTLELEDMGEISRMFGLLPGLPAGQAVAAGQAQRGTNPSGQNQGGQNQGGSDNGDDPDNQVSTP